VEAVPRRTGSRRAPAPEDLHRRAPPWTNRIAASSSPGSRSADSAVSRSPARGSRTAHLQGDASATKAVERGRSSKERRRRGRRPPPANSKPATSPPRRRRPVTLALLHYVHVARRGSPGLPPPERPAEAERTDESATARWRARSIYKSPSLHCRRGRGGPRSCMATVVMLLSVETEPV
jgi:hypothetical protein